MLLKLHSFRWVRNFWLLLVLVTGQVMGAPGANSRGSRAPQGPSARKEVPFSNLRVPTEQERSELKETRHFIVDVDNNFVNLDTQIILLEDTVNPVTGEKTVKEVPISTEKFAEVRNRIGVPSAPGAPENPWAKYRLLYDHADPKNSMRQFRPSENNHILSDLKKGLARGTQVKGGKSRPKIAGQAWDLTVEAFSNPETAKNTVILTARGHSREEMYAFFEHLKDEGWIQYLPEPENIFTVDNPEISKELGAKDISSAKAKVVGISLDKINAKVLPRKNVPAVYNADGTSARGAFSVYISDDDLGNLKAIRQTIEEGFKAKKWRDLKVVLFNTGKYRGSGLKPGGYAVKSDGSLRRLLPGEWQEAYGDHLVKKESFPKNPPAAVRKQMQGSVADALHMYVNHEYATRYPQAVTTGKSMDGALKKDLQEFIRNADPSDLKKIQVVAYSLDDQKVVDLLIEASKKGIQVELLTDLNNAMSGSFKKGQAFSSNFTQARFQNSSYGRALQRLVSAGAVINGKGPLVIGSQPLWSKTGAFEDAMTPSQHEKGYILYTRADPKRGVQEKIQADFRTGNLSNEDARFNRGFQVKNEELAHTMMKHNEEVLENFRDMKHIVDLKPEAPVRWQGKDGSFMEFAVSNGKYNLNDRSVDFLEELADDPHGRQLVDSFEAEFAPTYSRLHDALGKAMRAHPQSKHYAVVEGMKFFRIVNDHSNTPPKMGYDTARLFGPVMKGWEDNLTSRVQVFAYQRNIPGRSIKSLSGAPTNIHVFHDKTRAYRVIDENGKKWVYFSIGSMNGSANKANSELQVWGRVPAETDLAKGLVEAFPVRMRTLTNAAGKVIVERAVPAEWEKGHLVEGDIALYRNEVGYLTGHHALEVEVQTAKELRESVHQRDWDRVENILRRIADSPTELTSAAGPSERKENIDRLMKFLKWHEGLRSAQWPPKGHHRADERFLEMVAAISGENLKNAQYTDLIEKAVWEPGVDAQQLQDRFQKAWNIVGPERRKTPAPKGRDYFVSEKSLGSAKAEVKALIEKNRGFHPPSTKRRASVVPERLLSCIQQFLN